MTFPYITFHTSEEDKLARTSIKGSYNNLIIDGHGQGSAKLSIANIPSQVTTLDGVNIAYAARELLTRLEGGKPAGSTYMDDKQTVVSGNARVYQAQTEGEAQRNLDFAIANLTSYIRYVDGIKLEQEKRKAELKAAEEKAEKSRKRLQAGLDLYNKVMGTKAPSWGYTPVQSINAREKWAKQAEDIAWLKAESDPFKLMTNAINAATISAQSIRIGNYGF